jgi:uncharacterized membrane protein
MVLFPIAIIMLSITLDLLKALSATDIFMALITMNIIMALRIVDLNMNQKAVDAKFASTHLFKTPAPSFPR